MLKLYTWTTPNGYKVPIMLEELGLEYQIIPIDINAGAQKTPEFLALNPNHKIPVLIDDTAKGGAFTLSESGAILMYLAETHGQFLSRESQYRYAQIQWLMFQMASIGPMFGQAKHFLRYAPEKIDYAISRYSTEVNRLMGVLETRLASVPYLGAEFSIADIATWPWIESGDETGFIKVADYPHINEWYERIKSRPAVRRAIDRVDKDTKGNPGVCIPTYE